MNDWLLSCTRLLILFKSWLNSFLLDSIENLLNNSIDTVGVADQEPLASFTNFGYASLTLVSLTDSMMAAPSLRPYAPNVLDPLKPIIVKTCDFRSGRKVIFFRLSSSCEYSKYAKSYKKTISLFFISFKTLIIPLNSCSLNVNPVGLWQGSLMITITCFWILQSSVNFSLNDTISNWSPSNRLCSNTLSFARSANLSYCHLIFDTKIDSPGFEKIENVDAIAPLPPGVAHAFTNIFSLISCSYFPSTHETTFFLKVAPPSTAG